MPILRLQGPEENETAGCEARQGKIETISVSSPEVETVPPVLMVSALGTISCARRFELGQSDSEKV